MVLSALSSAAVVVAVRFAAVEIHPFEITFFRCLIAAVVMAPVLTRIDFKVLSARLVGLIAVRAVLVAAAMLTSFQALIVMPVLTATVLFFTAPFFATIGAALLFREPVGIHRWGALAAGFAGVLLIVRPEFGAGGVGVALALGSAVLSGGGWLCLKPLSRGMAAGTVVALTTAAMTPMALVPALFVWHTPSLETLWWLVLLGVAGSASQWAMTRAVAVANVGFVVGFEFLNVVVVAVVGMAIFAEPVVAWTAAGAVLIVGATSFVARWEINLPKRS